VTPELAAALTALLLVASEFLRVEVDRRRRRTGKRRTRQSDPERRDD